MLTRKNNGINAGQVITTLIIAILADYWLNNCSWLNDYCDGADLKPMNGKVDVSDLGTFVQQWLWCNNPNDPNCEHNW